MRRYISSSSGPSSSALVTVHIGYFPNITHAPALVGVPRGIFAKDLGPDTLATLQTFSAGPAENQALLSGSVDIAFEDRARSSPPTEDPIR